MAGRKYHIDPPPGEKGLYRVVYVIDVSASTALAAAESAHQIMTDPDSLAPVLAVLDAKGNVVTVDLSTN